MIVNDYRDLNQKELFEKIKHQLSLKQGPKPVLEVISYMSKIIPASLRKRPIFEKEALGMLTNLHSTRDLHMGSPALLIILDSQTAYFLFLKTISDTVHKVHRWSVTLQERYPNALLYAVPSAANISDWLSQNFEVPDKEKGNVNALYQSVGRQASLEGNWVSTSEMREKVEHLPSPRNTKTDSEIIPGDKEGEDMFQHAVSTRQSKRAKKFREGTNYSQDISVTHVIFGQTGD